MGSFWTSIEACWHLAGVTFVDELNGFRLGVRLYFQLVPGCLVEVLGAIGKLHCLGSCYEMEAFDVRSTYQHHGALGVREDVSVSWAGQRRNVNMVCRVVSFIVVWGYSTVMGR